MGDWQFLRIDEKKNSINDDINKKANSLGKKVKRKKKN